jgi:tRNA dimethylallyltransferase
MSSVYERERPPVVAVVGATGTGKTDLAIHLAVRFDGEVVSVDSRYLYRGLDIGTAKPDERERSGVPHHLIDILEPTDDYSLALYQRDASDAIAGIHKRTRLPFLAGGSPLYVRAVLEGWTIPEAPPDPAFRSEMEAFADEHGDESLHHRLAGIDPAAAARIPPSNRRRVIRALEVHHQTGRRMSDLEGKSPPPWDVLIIGLHIERTALLERIDRRVEAMLKRGLVEEVRGLLERGVPEDCTAMRSIGYQEVVPFLRGEYDHSEMADRMKFSTHRYVRHQLTWLRKTPGIHWFDALRAASRGEIEELVADHLRK